MSDLRKKDKNVLLKNKKRPLYCWKNSLFGFPNVGNSCYMNSFLQILLHTPHFVDTLKESNIGFSRGTLINLLIEISEYPDLYSLKKIKNIMAEEDNSYGREVQNDSQEFGICLINKIITIIKGNLSFEEERNEEEIDTIINKDYKIQKYINYKNKYCKKDIQLDEMFQFHEIMFNIDLNDNNIGRYKSIDFNSFLNIELTFPNRGKKNSYDLTELLKTKYPKNPMVKINKEDINSNVKFSDIIKNKFFEFIELLKSIFCSCNNINEDEFDTNNIDLFYTNLVSLPNILIISINRAFLGKNIINKRLIFKETLDLKDYIENDFLDGEKETKYKLYGVNLCYKNFMNYGHYYSYVKINDNWYKFNDDKPIVKETPEFDSKYVVGLYYIKENFI